MSNKLFKNTVYLLYCSNKGLINSGIQHSFAVKSRATRSDILDVTSTKCCNAFIVNRPSQEFVETLTAFILFDVGVQSVQ